MLYARTGVLAAQLLQQQALQYSALMRHAQGMTESKLLYACHACNDYGGSLRADERESGRFRKSSGTNTETYMALSMAEVCEIEADAYANQNSL